MQLLALLLGSALLTACAGGASDTSSIFTGAFLDSAVEGLHYRTETQSGVTAADGSFSYMEGETVHFSIGDVQLGQGTARPYMTPVDLVPGALDETDPAVTNMARMLQTMDADGNPDNGILIPEEMIEQMQGLDIDFGMDPSRFQNDDQVMMLMDALDRMGGDYLGRAMVSVEQARDHMGNTLMDMEDMMMDDMPGRDGMM